MVSLLHMTVTITLTIKRNNIAFIHSILLCNIEADDQRTIIGYTTFYESSKLHCQRRF